MSQVQQQQNFAPDSAMVEKKVVQFVVSSFADEEQTKTGGRRSLKGPKSESFKRSTLYLICSST